MRDLFGTGESAQHLAMPDADVDYFANFLTHHAADDLLRLLIADVPWREEKVVVWGKSHLQPRLIAWFGDVNSTYSYSGIRLSPQPWTPILLGVRNNVETLVGSRFNSVLLNYYRDQRDSMGFHSDDEPELGDRPVIASVSLGEERSFVFQHKLRKDLRPVRVRLESGSLLIMKGNTQRNWKHGIPKESKTCGPRVNLTFRSIRPISA